MHKIVLPIAVCVIAGCAVGPDYKEPEVTVPPASWRMIPGTTIADVAINQFSDGAARETRRAVRRALADGATGIVLDLRGNPGGLVNEAIGVADLFLPAE